MGLSDDVEDVDPRSEEQAAAEASVAAVEEAVQAGDVEGAVAAVGELIEDLYRMDGEAFADPDEPVLAKPTAHLPTRYGVTGVHADDHGEGGRLEINTVCGEVSIWANIPGDDGLYGEGSAGFHITPQAALWLADVLPDFAARAEAGESWEYTVGSDDT